MALVWSFPSNYPLSRRSSIERLSKSRNVRRKGDDDDSDGLAGSNERPGEDEKIDPAGARQETGDLPYSILGNSGQNLTVVHADHSSLSTQTIFSASFSSLSIQASSLFAISIIRYQIRK